ncbi:hypothetical protein [Bacillus toyonensis]|uniref:hypothetical protein n=1 Tax=Bacillus toyonensis TaxID=155322 RepID=UPI002E1AB559|nr:hypothetical protein [Bacillus toyonensis]
MIKFVDEVNTFGYALKSKVELRKAIEVRARESKKYLKGIEELQGKPDLAMPSPIGTVLVVYNDDAVNPEIRIQFQNTFGETFDVALIQCDMHTKYILVDLWEQGSKEVEHSYRWNTKPLPTKEVDNTDNFKILKEELSATYAVLGSLSEIELQEVLVKQAQLELEITKKVHRMVSSTLFVETPLGTISAIYEPNEMPDPYIHIAFKHHDGEDGDIIDIEYNKKENAIKVHNFDNLLDEWSTNRFDKNPLVDAFSTEQN